MSACPRLGFELRLALNDGLPEPGRLALRRALDAALDERGLRCRGGGTASWRLVLWREGDQATELDRTAMVEWGEGRREIAAVEAGPVVDVESAG